MGPLTKSFDIEGEARFEKDLEFDFGYVWFEVILLVVYT